jgi:hypothetical protein
MNKEKIKELYEKAYVVHEVPYESSVVDPTIVSIHKHKVWDPYLFAELVWNEAYEEGHDAGVLLVLSKPQCY